MQTENLDTVPLYPENKKCKSPTTDLIFETFDDVRLQHICKANQPIAIVPDTLSKRQELVLKLLNIKPTKYFATG
jgi:hypothetical protein